MGGMGAFGGGFGGFGGGAIGATGAAGMGVAPAPIQSRADGTAPVIGEPPTSAPFVVSVIPVPANPTNTPPARALLNDSWNTIDSITANVEPASLEENAKPAEPLLMDPCGPESMAVSGAVLSTVTVRPPEVVALDEVSTARAVIVTGPSAVVPESQLTL